MLMEEIKNNFEEEKTLKCSIKITDNSKMN